MARRATVINQVRGEASGPALLLDAGNALFGDKFANDTDGAVVIEAMNAMGYDAMGLGALDQTRGLGVLRARAAEAAFPFVSCTLLDGAGKLLFAPYTVVERAGVRFGILGVSDPMVAQMPLASGSVVVAGSLEAVQHYLPEVRSKSDVVILLSLLDIEQDRALARQVPGIDVIVSGKSRQVLDRLEVVGSTVLVAAGYRGERLGRLDAQVTAEGLSGASVQVITLGPEIADDPVMSGLIGTIRRAVYMPTPSPVAQRVRWPPRTGALGGG